MRVSSPPLYPRSSFHSDDSLNARWKQQDECVPVHVWRTPADSLIQLSCNIKQTGSSRERDTERGKNDSLLLINMKHALFCLFSKAQPNSLLNSHVLNLEQTSWIIVGTVEQTHDVHMIISSSCFR